MEGDSPVDQVSGNCAGGRQQVVAVDRHGYFLPCKTDQHNINGRKSTKPAANEQEIGGKSMPSAELGTFGIFEFFQ